MDKNPNKKFYATGDEYQLEPIETLNIIETEKYYNSIINRMFPHQIVLKDNKRCKTKEDQEKIKTISKSIRDAASKEDAMKIIKANFKTTSRLEDIKTLRNVVGLNSTGEMLNELLHQKKNGEKFYVGMEVVGRKTFKNKDYQIYSNYTYTIVDIDSASMTVDDGDIEHEVPIEKVEILFKMSYARTANSYQGLSEEQPITIFDTYSNWITVKWFYTAITRATNLDNIYIYVGKYKSNVIPLENVIKSRIQGHFQADLDSFLTEEEMYDYVSVEWVLETLKKVKKCVCCGVHLTQETFSIDRLNNDVCHSKGNCRIICRHCNISKVK